MSQQLDLSGRSFVAARVSSRTFAASKVVALHVHFCSCHDNNKLILRGRLCCRFGWTTSVNRDGDDAVEPGIPRLAFFAILVFREVMFERLGYKETEWCNG